MATWNTQLLATINIWVLAKSGAPGRSHWQPFEYDMVIQSSDDSQNMQYATECNASWISREASHTM